MGVHLCKYNCGGTGCYAPIKVDKQTKQQITLQHEPPKYYGYKGDFANITLCMKCSNRGLREDCHPANVCKHCGGKVVELGSGKWIKPKYKWSLWGRTKVKDGYWERGLS